MQEELFPLLLYLISLAQLTRYGANKSAEPQKHTTRKRNTVSFCSGEWLHVEFLDFNRVRFYLTFYRRKISNSVFKSQKTMATPDTRSADDVLLALIVSVGDAPPLVRACVFFSVGIIAGAILTLISRCLFGRCILRDAAAAVGIGLSPEATNDRDKAM